jgi:phosphatidate cytidylyltransferase
MSQLGFVTAGLLVLLLTASLIGHLLKRRSHAGPPQAVIINLNQRIRAWWVMTLVLLSCLWVGRETIVVLFACLSILALREFSSLTEARRRDRTPPLPWLYLLIPLQYWLVASDRYGLFAILIPACAFLVLPAVWALRGETRRFLERHAVAQFGLLWTVYCVSHVPALQFVHIPDYEGQSILLVLYLLLVAQMSDVLQYVFGKTWGKRLLAPHVSPSKTVEGLIGGGLSATLLGGLMWWITPFSPAASLGFSALIVLCGFLGGLTLSAVKRSYGAKDWSSLVRGHGGVLDRLDSICFSAPVFFHAVRILYG